MISKIHLAVFSCALALTLPAAAQTGGAPVVSPGSVTASQSVDFAAKITSIQPEKRIITLVGPGGEELQVIAGPEFRNFNQLKAGQTVQAKYYEWIVINLKKGGGQRVERTDSEVGGSAMPGETPGATARWQTKVIGDVTRVNPANQTITVRGPRRIVDIKVDDPSQFRQIAAGDQLELTYTESVVFSVRQ
jgi:hypothetical protein